MKTPKTEQENVRTITQTMFNAPKQERRKRTRIQARDKTIIERVSNGVAHSELAREFDLTPRQIRNISKRNK
eukprot:3320226-Rhodomonas_salina.1